MSWFNKRIMRWDIGLSIFFILLTIFAILYTRRLECYQIETEEVLIGSWWCHVDTPHGHLDQEREKKGKKPQMARENPSKPPRTK